MAGLLKLWVGDRVAKCNFGVAKQNGLTKHM